MRFSPTRLFSLSAILLLLAACGAPKPKPEEVAEAFVADIKKGNSRRAYDATTFSFQAQQTLEAFDSKLRDLEVRKYQSVVWKSQDPTSTANDVKLKGSLQREPDVEVPIKISLHRDGRRWLVSALAIDARTADGAAVSFSSIGESIAILTATATRTPSVEESQALVRETLTHFDAALQTHSFEEFYKTISTMWQKQISSSRLADSFAKYEVEGVRFKSPEQAKVTFRQPPRIQSRMVLLLDGEAESQPHPVQFILKYIYETPKWRLLSVALNVETDEQNGVESPAPSATPAAP